MRPKISIIMPVYNAVSYLSDAIESVLRQTYKDFELILIDDGSNDGSSQICEEYYKKDKRVVLKKQINSGICGARNTALDICRGEFITFCDHDDVYVKDYLEKAVSVMKKTNADIVRVSYEEQLISKNSIKAIKTRVFKDEVYGLEGIFRNYLFFQLNISTVWNCLYKRNIIDNVIFDTNMRFGGEDICFNINILILNRLIKIATISDILYIHYKRIGQSASAKFNKNRLDSFDNCIALEHRLFIKHLDRISKIQMITNSQAFYFGGYLSILERAGKSLIFTKKLEILKELREKEGFKEIVEYKKLFRLNYGPKYTLMLFLFKLKMFSIIIIIMEMRKIIFRKE